MKDDVELKFKRLLTDLIKPFGLVIGEKSVSIAENLFKQISKEEPEIKKIGINGRINIIFAGKSSEERKKEILLEVTKRLIKEYNKEAGKIAESMIKFILQDYKIPASILKN